MILFCNPPLQTTGGSWMPHAGNFLNLSGTTVNTPLKTEVGRQVCFTSQILPPRDKATPQSAASWPRFTGRKSLSSTKAPLVTVVLETWVQARLLVTLRCFPEVQCLKLLPETLPDSQSCLWKLLINLNLSPNPISLLSFFLLYLYFPSSVILFCIKKIKLWNKT